MAQAEEGQREVTSRGTSPFFSRFLLLGFAAHNSAVTINRVKSLETSPMP
jgi:hypothetical protein